jgi:glycosyltransferase involved in cell wall biosynthesis
MRTGLQQLIAEQDLGGQVFLHGNVSKDALKDYYRKAHFLVFLSRSEGWPKAVAEAMWWGCVPITTPVSCVPWMLAQGERGFLAEDATAAVRAIVQCLTEPESYTHKAAKAAEWSRQFTLENFEEAIVQIMYPHA